MKLALGIVATLAVWGCSQGDASRSPMAPDLTTIAPSTSLFVMVVDAHTSSCIVGATVQVVRGQRLGESLTQTTPCGAWDYGGEIQFKDLTPGVEMTLRASAPGYTSHELSVVPRPQVVLLTPGRIPTPE